MSTDAPSYEVDESRTGSPFRVLEVLNGTKRTIALTTTKSDAETVCDALRVLADLEDPWARRN